jgi:hypothetical protein
MLAVRVRPGRPRIVCERVYFDAQTILRQLGLATNPRTRSAAGSRRPRCTRSPSTALRRSLRQK